MQIGCSLYKEGIMYRLLILFALLVTACGPSQSEIRQQQYNAWYQTLSPEQQEREDQRQHERSLAAMQAFSAMQSAHPIFPRSAPATTMPMPYQFQQAPAWQPRQRTNCTSNVIGSQVYTNCY